MVEEWGSLFKALSEEMASRMFPFVVAKCLVEVFEEQRIGAFLVSKMNLDLAVGSNPVSGAGGFPIFVVECADCLLYTSPSPRD